MSIDSVFEISEEKRTAFIDENILLKLPEDVRDGARVRATNIVNHYAGMDSDALSVLFYAAERGRFDEFAEKLEKHYQEDLKYVHPEARRHHSVPGAFRAASFFLNCYRSTEIQPGQ